jgi:hypothetical protein
LIVIEEAGVASSLILKGTLCASYRYYSQFLENEGVAEHADFDPQGPRFQSVEFSYQIAQLQAVMKMRTQRSR